MRLSSAKTNQHLLGDGVFLLLLELWQDRDRLQVGRHIHMFGPQKNKNNLTKPKAIIIKINIYFPKIFCSIFVVFVLPHFFFGQKSPYLSWIHSFFSGIPFDFKDKNTCGLADDVTIPHVSWGTVWEVFVVD